MAADPDTLDHRLPRGFRSPPPPVRPKARRPGALTAYLFLIPAFVIFGGLIIYPLFDGIGTAFTDRVIARGGQFIGFDNFLKLLDDEEWRLLATRWQMQTSKANRIRLWRTGRDTNLILHGASH